MARAFTPDGRVSVMNRDVTVVRAGETHTHRLADRDELRALFAEHFAIDLPDVAVLRVPSVPEWL